MNSPPPEHSGVVVHGVGSLLLSLALAVARLRSRSRSRSRSLVFALAVSLSLVHSPPLLLMREVFEYLVEGLGSLSLALALALSFPHAAGARESSTPTIL